MMFRLNGIDPEAAGEAWKTIPSLMDEAEAAGTFPRKGAIVRPQQHDVEWRVNFTQLARADGTAINGLEPNELTRGEIEGRRQRSRRSSSCARCRVLKDPTSSTCRRSSASATRRVAGAGYRLSGDDVLGCAAFDDSIGVNGWPMESHVAGGDVIFKFPPIPESRGFNELPYRMLVPGGVDNLLMAGRCASMTHDGQSAARVSGACFPATARRRQDRGGAGAGGNTIPRDIAAEKLQQQLKRQGAFIGQGQRVPEGL